MFEIIFSVCFLFTDPVDCKKETVAYSNLPIAALAQTSDEEVIKDLMRQEAGPIARRYTKDNPGWIVRGWAYRPVQGTVS